MAHRMRRGVASVVAGVVLAGSALATTPRIVGGEFTSLHPATGALLYGASPDTATLVCSGILIGCRTLLTAAHCVCPERGRSCRDDGAVDPAPWSVFFQHEGFRAVVSIATHPQFVFPMADVAVVTLAEPVDGIAPVPLARGVPPVGSLGTIVGFGNSGMALDFGLKRHADVHTSACGSAAWDRGLVCWEYMGLGGDTCVGDSGGPLLVGGLVAGVTSGGTNDYCEAFDLAYDANVATYRDWILDAAGADATRLECGTLPQAGGADAAITGVVGTLDEERAVATHRLPVPPGTKVLRVTMNAHDDGVANFDLAVALTRGGVPSSTPRCDAIAAGQYAACAFTRPDADEAMVEVARRAGAGTYQVTMTAFGAVSEVPLCSDTLAVGRLRTRPQVTMRARIGDPDQAFDPRTAPVVLALDDGVAPIDTAIPANDAGWRVTRSGYHWRAASTTSGLARVAVRRRERGGGGWDVRLAGRDVANGMPRARVTAVRLELGGRCWTGAVEPAPRRDRRA